MERYERASNSLYDLASVNALLDFSYFGNITFIDIVSGFFGNAYCVCNMAV